MSDWVELCSWLLFAWALGWGLGFLYLTFKKISDIIV